MRLPTYRTPAPFSTRAHASSVAPVVMTSSTKSTRRPLRQAASAAANAPLTFSRRRRWDKPACGGVERTRRRHFVRQGVAIKRDNSLASNSRLIELATPPARAVERYRDNQVNGPYSGCNRCHFPSQRLRQRPHSIVLKQVKSGGAGLLHTPRSCALRRMPGVQAGKVRTDGHHSPGGSLQMAGRSECRKTSLPAAAAPTGTRHKPEPG